MLTPVPIPVSRSHFSCVLPPLVCCVGDAQAGVVKMNVDTDTQWAYWDGVKGFYQVKEASISHRRARHGHHVTIMDCPLSN